jgi:sec-independent protein translocase protein TatC
MPTLPEHPAAACPPEKAEDSRMSLGDHLDELRTRLVLALAGFAVALLASLGAGRWFVQAILSPYRRAMIAAGLDLKLQAFQPAEPFLVYVKASMVLAALLGSPWIFYQIWAFVASGLHRNERRFVHAVAGAGSVLFAAGALFFLGVVAPGMFRFFIRFDLGLDYLAYQPGIGRTVDFILALALVFGVAFQTPMAIVAAERMELVSLATLRRVRKYAFLAAFVVGALATPPDVVSQVSLALPLYALYEVGVLACRLGRKRRP